MHLGLFLEFQCGSIDVFIHKQYNTALIIEA